MTLGRRRGWSFARRPFDQRQQFGAPSGREAPKATKLTVRRAWVRAVTFVMFVVTRQTSGAAQRLIPGRGERGGARTGAKAVCALPAHPRCSGGAGDIAGSPKRDDEGDLLVLRPAMMTGTCDRRKT